MFVTVCAFLDCSCLGFINAAFGVNMEFVYRKLPQVEGFSVTKTVC